MHPSDELLQYELKLDVPTLFEYKTYTPELVKLPTATQLVVELQDIEEIGPSKGVALLEVKFCTSWADQDPLLDDQVNSRILGCNEVSAPAAIQVEVFKQSIEFKDSSWLTPDWSCNIHEDPLVVYTSIGSIADDPVPIATQLVVELQDIEVSDEIPEGRLCSVQAEPELVE